MLTGDLVRVRVAKGAVVPGFVDPASPRMVERAEELVALFREGVGRRRGELEEEVAAIVGDGVDHKLTKGLVKVLLDRSAFGVEAPVDPFELRARVFREAARRGPLAEVTVEGGRATAADVYAAVAAELGVDAALLPEALYADHADQQVLREVDVPSAAWLLHRYNVALVQAVLLKAAQIRARLVEPTPAKARQLFRAVKFHQLIAAARPLPDGVEVALDGPASLFSQTTRYGVALARFFPALLLQERWTLEADVELGRGKATLKLSSADGLRSHYRDVGGWETREAQWFAERFEALDSGWTLVRDAAPLSQGGEALVVPDFSFRKGKRVAHLEILGFWRKGSLQKRLELLRRHGPSNLVLAVSRKMAGEAADLPDVVVPFAEVVPAKEVLARIEAVACAEGTEGARPGRRDKAKG